MSTSNKTDPASSQQGNIGHQQNPRTQSQAQGEQRTRLDESAVSPNQQKSPTDKTPLKEDVGQRGGRESANDTSQTQSRTNK